MENKTAFTAYKFVKSEENRDYTPKGFNRYHRETVAAEIEWRNRGPNFDTDVLRRTSAYEEAEDLFYELTMSGSREEAMFCLRHWMDKAWAWQWREKNWEIFFLAAYYIYKKLEQEEA